MIVVDDGSTDSTLRLLEPYKTRIQGLIVVRHDSNQGVGAARNSGVELANGRYVTFLDSDDEYHPCHLADRKKILLETPNVQLLHGGVEVIGDPYVVDKNDYGKQIHLSECAIGGTFFIRRDVFDTVGVFSNLPYADDSEFFERASSKGIIVLKTSMPSYRYFRDTQNQITANVGRDNKTMFETAWRAIRRRWSEWQFGLIGATKPTRRARTIRCRWGSSSRRSSALPRTTKSRS